MSRTDRRLDILHALSEPDESHKGFRRASRAVWEVLPLAVGLVAAVAPVAQFAAVRGADDARPASLFEAIVAAVAITTVAVVVTVTLALRGHRFRRSRAAKRARHRYLDRDEQDQIHRLRVYLREHRTNIDRVLAETSRDSDRRTRLRER